MILALLAIISCQLIGDAVIILTGLPIPGSVVGIVILFTFFVINGGIPANIAKVADVFLDNLILFFIPVTAAFLGYYHFIADNLVAILCAITVSSILTFAASGWTMMWLLEKEPTEPGDDHNA